MLCMAMADPMGVVVESLSWNDSLGDGRRAVSEIGGGGGHAGVGVRGKIIRLNTSNCSIESPRLCIPIGMRKGSRKRRGKAKEHCFTVQMNAAPSLHPDCCLLSSSDPFKEKEDSLSEKF